MSLPVDGELPARVLLMSRKGSARPVAIAAVFVAAGVLLVVEGAAGTAGWAVLVFFGLGPLLSGIELIKPSVLELNSAGFALRYTMPPRSITRTWSECGEFAAWQISKRAEQVVYRTLRGDKPKLRRVNRAMSGGDECIRAGFDGMTAPALAELMNRYRQRSAHP